MGIAVKVAIGAFILVIVGGIISIYYMKRRERFVGFPSDRSSIVGSVNQKSWRMDQQDRTGRNFLEGFEDLDDFDPSKLEGFDDEDYDEDDFDDEDYDDEDYDEDDFDDEDMDDEDYDEEDMDDEDYDEDDFDDEDYDEDDFDDEDMDDEDMEEEDANGETRRRRRGSRRGGARGGRGSRGSRARRAGSRAGRRARRGGSAAGRRARRAGSAAGRRARRAGSRVRQAAQRPAPVPTPLRATHQAVHQNRLVRRAGAPDPRPRPDRMYDAYRRDYQNDRMLRMALYTPSYYRGCQQAGTRPACRPRLSYRPLPFNAKKSSSGPCVLARDVSQSRGSVSAMEIPPRVQASGTPADVAVAARLQQTPARPTGRRIRRRGSRGSRRGSRGSRRGSRRGGRRQSGRRGSRGGSRQRRRGSRGSRRGGSRRRSGFMDTFLAI